MSKFKGISNIEQGILNVETLKNNDGVNHARQHFDIGHSLFNIQYSLFKTQKISPLSIQQKKSHFQRRKETFLCLTE